MSEYVFWGRLLKIELRQFDVLTMSKKYTNTLENALRGKRMCSFSVAAAFLRPFDEE